MPDATRLLAMYIEGRGDRTVLDSFMGDAFAVARVPYDKARAGERLDESDAANAFYLMLVNAGSPENDALSSVLCSIRDAIDARWPEHHTTGPSLVSDVDEPENDGLQDIAAARSLVSDLRAWAVDHGVEFDDVQWDVFEGDRRRHAEESS